MVDRLAAVLHKTARFEVRLGVAPARIVNPQATIRALLDAMLPPTAAMTRRARDDWDTEIADCDDHVSQADMAWAFSVQIDESLG